MIGRGPNDGARRGAPMSDAQLRDEMRGALLERLVGVPVVTTTATRKAGRADLLARGSGGFQHAITSGPGGSAKSFDTRSARRCSTARWLM